MGNIDAVVRRVAGVAISLAVTAADRVVLKSAVLGPLFADTDTVAVAVTFGTIKPVGTISVGPAFVRNAAAAMGNVDTA